MLRVVVGRERVGMAFFFMFCFKMNFKLLQNGYFYAFLKFFC